MRTRGRTRGYIGQNLFDTVFAKGVELITKSHKKSHKKMKPRLLTLMDKLLLRKRAIIETIIDQCLYACIKLKNISQVELYTPPRTCRVPVEPRRRADCLLPPAQKTAA